MRTKSLLVFALVSLVLIIARSGSSATPAQQTTAKNDTDNGPDKTNFDVSAFLDKYGYNPCNKQVKSKNESLCPYSTQSMLKDFQRQFGLPIPGEPDSKVLDLMKTPRCSVSDLLSGLKPAKSW